MAYDKKQQEAINKKQYEVTRTYRDLTIKLMSFMQELKSKKAKEYLAHGVTRRLKIITRCIDNIFEIFPVCRTKKLTQDELSDLAINLHAFFINIPGIFDNLGWVFVFEKDLYGKKAEGKLTRVQVGIFNNKTQAHLSPDFRSYLTNDPIKRWQTDYSTNYRDALAHRIPLYVPPSLLDDDEAKEMTKLEEERNSLDLSTPASIVKYGELLDKENKLGRVSHLLSHSIDEGSKPIYFHAQVLADHSTVEEIITKFIESFK